MDLTFCELREKEIINIADGKKLGRITDIVMTGKGKVMGIVAPGERKLFKGGADNNIFVPWCNICKIGNDVILVELGGNLPAEFNGV
ncbi:MAG: YlmC/YmxH family sporulation protein [Clostridiales bacterium]|jgi:YlmC/YmxH family sporulation protein|nr:YlmC/YmxH family sporulation protein [Clostridiales bacterium]